MIEYLWGIFNPWKPQFNLPFEFKVDSEQIGKQVHQLVNEFRKGGQTVGFIHEDDNATDSKKLFVIGIKEEHENTVVVKNPLQSDAFADVAFDFTHGLIFLRHKVMAEFVCRLLSSATQDYTTDNFADLPSNYMTCFNPYTQMTEGVTVSMTDKAYPQMAIVQVGLARRYKVPVACLWYDS